MPPNPEQTATILRIVNKLGQLGHEVSWREPITSGPLITTYRFVPSAKTRVAQVINCADDITITLGCDQDVLIRMLPGEAVLGISVPNATRQPVLWRDTLASPPSIYNVPLNLGTDEQGRLYQDDLTLLPHLLIAGSTGTGKSTELNSIVASLIYWRDDFLVKLALSDTKNVEFPMFDGDSHLWCPRATSKYTTWQILDELYNETVRRMTGFARTRAKNIAEYNSHTAPSKREPYIVLLIDELATVLEGDKRGEAKIAQSKIGRIVQLSRAAGIHLIAATQRPSVDVVIGSIKNNFPARLTFRLTSGTDSRTVINSEGAERLISRGDMLYQSPLRAGLKRLHASYATNSDLEQCLKLTNMKGQAQPWQINSSKSVM